MEGYEEWVEAMLEEDQRMPRKQRRTAQKIYEELLEIGYLGSARTVRDYVRHIKLELQEREAEQSIRLEHRAGEAQVDFGEFRAIHGQEVKNFYELIVSFPYSNGQLCWVLPAENRTLLFPWASEPFLGNGRGPYRHKV